MSASSLSAANNKKDKVIHMSGLLPSLSLPSAPCSGEPSPISGHPCLLNYCHISLAVSMAAANIVDVSSSWALSAQAKVCTLMEMDVRHGDALDDVQDKWINHGSQIRETRALSTAVCETVREVWNGHYPFLPQLYWIFRVLHAVWTRQSNQTCK